MMRSTVRICFTAIILISFAGTGLAGEKLSLFVSVAPQKYFVQQIGKDLVDVQIMVQPGASPATYEPRPRQMAELAKAQAYFAIGVPFEDTWLKRIAAANPAMTVVHTDQGIDKRPMAAHHLHDEAGEDHPEGAPSSKEDHRHAGEQRHSGLDPHIWLSPPLVRIQARTILSALQVIDPAHQNVYETNFGQFLSRIDQLDSQLRQTFADRQGLKFIVFHPAWGYFAQAYGIEQVPIEIEGKDPKPAQLQELISYARKAGIKVVFVQPQFSTKSARLVAQEIGGQVAFADPLAEDWMANLRTVALKFQAALK
jgi:zinc transport system substrate-binding protein